MIGGGQNTYPNLEKWDHIVGKKDGIIIKEKKWKNG